MKALSATSTKASKTVAGNAFQGLVAYALVRHQQAGILSQDIEITLKPKRHRIINEYATIKVGNDVQKPDIDLLIYSKDHTLQKPVIIYNEDIASRADWPDVQMEATDGYCHYLPLTNRRVFVL
jgi:hypothetical protein